MVKQTKNKLRGEDQLFWVKPLFMIMSLIFLIYVGYYFIFQSHDSSEQGAVLISQSICNMPPKCQIYYIGQESPIYDNFCDGNIKIGSFETEVTGCYFHAIIRYDNLKEEMNKSKSYSMGIIDMNKIKEYIDTKGYFFVENPNTQIEANGNVNLHGTGHSSYSSCGAFFCSSGSGSMEMDISGTISINGQLKAPVSIITEDRLNQLENGNDYVKCYLQNFEIYTDQNIPLKKLICGIEKNNVFVVAEIKSIESSLKVCQPIDVLLFSHGTAINSLKVNAGTTCSEVWKWKSNK